jgi:hypothetical protein
MDSQHAAGTGIGFLAGIIKGVEGLNLFTGQITWQLAFDTIILASIGAAGGWLVTEALRWAKKKLKK